MLDEFFFDFSGNISAYDEFEYIERKEKIEMMIELILFQNNDDNKILDFLCNLIDNEAFINYLCKEHHIIRDKNNHGNTFTVDTQYVKDWVYENR